MNDSHEAYNQLKTCAQKVLNVIRSPHGHNQTMTIDRKDRHIIEELADCIQAFNENEKTWDFNIKPIGDGFVKVDLL